MRTAITLVAAVAVTGGVVAPPANAVPQAPDLVLTLPAEPYGGDNAQIAPVFVDAVEVPGRLLYRFDAVLHNVGGTLDVWRDPVTGDAVQGLWPDGRPDPPPDPAAPPSPESAVTRSVRTPAGARFEFVVEPSHEHWHFFSAARYEIEVPGAVRASDKIGFCFFDGFDVEATGEAHFAWERQGDDGETWCGFDRPDDPFVRMGLSPGAADRYASQRELQWVDVTGLPPGPAVLRGVANPYGHLDEGGASENNVLAESRVLPGVTIAAAAARTDEGRPVDVALEATVVAPGVPARRGGGCVPQAGSADCYRWHREGDPLQFAITQAPGHGTATVQPGDPVTLRYTPEPGYAGEDVVTVSATDNRGLTSPPAEVRIAVQAAAAGDGQAAVPAPATTPTPASRPATVALIQRPVVRRRRGRLALQLTAARPLRLSGTIRRRGSARIVARLRTRRLAAGRRAVTLPRISRRGAHVLTLTARVGELVQTRRVAFAVPRRP